MRVYIKTDSKNRITGINSELFIDYVSGWTEIDSGDGDKFAHAQGNYLPDTLADVNGVYRYKFQNGIISERSADEMAADMPADTPVQPTDHERIEALEQALGSIMVGYYVMQIKLGKTGIDNVPDMWRESVRKETEG